MEQIFKDNPKLDVAYKTADGKYFFLESDAINHAKTLENKKVKKLDRPDEEPQNSAPPEPLQDDIGEQEIKNDNTLKIEETKEVVNDTLNEQNDTSEKVQNELEGGQDEKLTEQNHNDQNTTTDELNNASDETQNDLENQEEISEEQEEPKTETEPKKDNKKTKTKK